MQGSVLITGASKGIGLALARVFLDHHFAVLGTSRNGAVPELEQHPQFRSLALDLSQPASIQRFAADLKARGLRFDVLVNNAGIGPDLDTERPDPTTFQQTLDVNLTGTVFLTELLLPLLNQPGKLANISSKMGSIEVCQLSDSVAYRVSKAGLNMFTKILANRLQGQHRVAAIHPGWVRTTLTPGNRYGRLSPEESAERIFDFVSGDFANGTFWNVETQSVCAW